MGYYSVSDFYKNLFGTKVYKISLYAGCTCPTRDGTKGYGGCIFCSANGSGDFVPSRTLSITQQIEQAKLLISKKLKTTRADGAAGTTGTTGAASSGSEKKYIAYFQNFTNTYGDLDKLRSQWEEALFCEGIVGIAIATRPDCLPTSCIDALSQLAEKTFVQVELGLQTSNSKTAEYIRRRFPNSDYDDAVARIQAVNNRLCVDKQLNPFQKIHIVTHIIFGLPGENSEDMMNSVRYAVNVGTDGIKIANLYVLQGTDLEKDYKNHKFEVLEMEEYFDLLKQAVKLIPPGVVIHRLTGDPPKKLLTAPKWVENKKMVLNQLKTILN